VGAWTTVCGGLLGGVVWGGSMIDCFLVGESIDDANIVKKSILMKLKLILPLTVVGGLRLFSIGGCLLAVVWVACAFFRLAVACWRLSGLLAPFFGWRLSVVSWLGCVHKNHFETARTLTIAQSRLPTDT
jgi:hypothetical protein